MSITAMKQALSALVDIEQATDLKRLYRYDDETRMDEVVEDAIAALRTAIAEAEKVEQVRWGVDWGTHGDQSCVSIVKQHVDGTLEVVAIEYQPPQAQSDHVAGDGNMVQPLTFDQIEDIWTKHGLNECDCHGFARAIEQAHLIGERP